MRCGLGIVACLALAACGRQGLLLVPTGGTCVPGQQVACSCLDGRDGAKVCEAGGQGPCRCGSSDAGGASTAGSGAGNKVAGAGGASGSHDGAGAAGTATGGAGSGGSSAAGAGAGGANHDSAGAAGSATGGSGASLATGAAGASNPGLGACSVAKLGFDVLDAEYSTTLDAIVLVSDNPSALHVLNPVTLTDRAVPLPARPAAVSVSLDGTQAAVAHDALVSLVDLKGATLVKAIATTCDAFDIVLAGNGFAYVFPNTNQWVSIHSVDLTQGIERSVTPGNDVYEKTHAKLHPNGHTMYGSTAQLSPSDLEEYDSSQGIAKVLVGVGGGPDFGQHQACGEIWMSLDGARVFSGCGNVFSASPNSATDLRYAGKLTSGNADSTLQSVAHSKNGKVYTIEGSPSVGTTHTTFNDGVLDVFDYQYLNFEKTLPIPCIKTDTGSFAPHARFVFANNDGTKLWVLITVAAGATWGLVGVAP
jgi:hypothetical protein